MIAEEKRPRIETERPGGVGIDPRHGTTRRGMPASAAVENAHEIVGGRLPADLIQGAGEVRFPRPFPPHDQNRRPLLHQRPCVERDKPHPGQDGPHHRLDEEAVPVVPVKVRQTVRQHPPTIAGHQEPADRAAIDRRKDLLDPTSRPSAIQDLRTMPTIYRFSSDVLQVDVDSETMLLSYASGKYFGLTGAISRLTDNLREGASLDEMAPQITGYYDVTEAAARDDLARILTELQAAGLVVSSEA